MNIIDTFISENVEVNTLEGRTLMVNLDESSKLNLSDKLVTALYKTAVSKYSDIDFGEIPESKGDITRLKHFSTITESLNNVQSILTSTNSELPELQVIQNAIKTLTAYRKDFCMAFIQENEMCEMIYNTIVMSIICGTNLCIYSVVDFLRTPGQKVEDAMKVQRNNKKDTALLIDNLMKFNESANKGELKKIFDNNLKRNNFIGTGLGIAVGVSTVTLGLIAAVAIIPVTRELIYFFYDFRMKVSDYLKQQAMFVEMNVAELTANSGSPEVIKRQQLKIEQLKKLANTFEVKFNQSEKNTKKSINKKIDASTANRVMTSMENQFQLI